MTVAVMGLLGVALILWIAAMQLVVAAQAAHRARAAADLGALAAAGVVLEGGAQPCESARVLVQRNGARLRGCSLGTGADVTVTASVVLSWRIPGVPREATASSRAGPARPI